jgi:hypothetical protein
LDWLTSKRMAKLIAAAQPLCTEEITAAVTCNRAHSDSAGSDLLTAGWKPLAGARVRRRVLGPVPDVLLAVGSRSFWAFECAPKVFGIEIKRLVASWPRDGVRVVAEKTMMMIYVIVAPRSGERHAFELSAMSMRGAQLAIAFLDAVGAKDYRVPNSV